MGLLWDRNLDDGDGEVKMTELPLDGSSAHVSQHNPQGRWSWETDGELDTADDQHYTNQSVGKHHPDRHRYTR
jgi:hypothetical protein